MRESLGVLRSLGVMGKLTDSSSTWRPGSYLDKQRWEKILSLWGELTTWVHCYGQSWQTLMKTEPQPGQSAMGGCQVAQLNKENSFPFGILLNINYMETTSSSQEWRRQETIQTSSFIFCMLWRCFPMLLTFCFLVLWHWEPCWPWKDLTFVSS